MKVAALIPSSFVIKERHFYLRKVKYISEKEMPLKDVMHTSKPIYDYEFSCTIDNLTRALIPSVRGPSFSPIPGSLEKFCYELNLRIVSHSPVNKFVTKYKFDLELNLLNLNARDSHFNVLGSITLRYRNGILFSHKSTVKVVGQTTPLCSYTWLDEISHSFYKSSAMELADNKIITEGKLKFSVKEPSKNNEDLLKDFKTLYESGLASDVTFSVGEKKLLAHKAIIGVRSPVFAKMFEHDMLENNTNNVIIEDIDSGIFHSFLLFLYTAVLEDDKHETVISLYSMAQKYQVKSLQEACSVLLVNKLAVESVCSVLVLADLHNDQELKNSVKIFIRNNFFDMAGTPNWFELVTTKAKLADEVLSYLKSLHS